MMKRKSLVTLVYWMLPFILSACVVASGGTHTAAITTPDAKKAAFKTFAWYQETPVAPVAYESGYTASLNEHIRRAIAAELQAKGYQKVAATANPDVLVAYDVSVSVPEEKDIAAHFAPGFGYSYAYMSGYRYTYSNAGLPGYRPVDLFKQGTLLVDLINPETGTLRWRGWSEGVVTNFKASYKKVHQQVSEVLKQLPAA